MRKTCKDCEWWRKNPLGKAGQCFGDLPKVFPLGILPDGQPLYGTTFPETDSDIYCAKFKEKTSEE